MFCILYLLPNILWDSHTLARLWTFHVPNTPVFLVFLFVQYSFIHRRYGGAAVYDEKSEAMPPPPNFLSFLPIPSHNCHLQERNCYCHLYGKNGKMFFVNSLLKQKSSVWVSSPHELCVLSYFVIADQDIPSRKWCPCYSSLQNYHKKWWDSNTKFPTI